MSDRETLAAAILGYTAKGEPERVPDLTALITAGRERLAQLPPYPAETVETIGGVTADPRWAHIESPLLMDFALAVLDALNRSAKPADTTEGGK